jgi:hypothetical protein
LERKALISSHIASCQATYLSASEKAIGLEKGESNTRVAAVSAAAEATIFAVLGCRGLSTIGWRLSNSGDAGEVSVTEVSYYSG